MAPGEMPILQVLLIYRDYRNYWTCCLKMLIKKKDSGLFPWMSFPTIRCSVIIQIKFQLVFLCCSCCLVVCGRETFGCCCLTQSPTVSIYFVGLSLCRCQLCGAEFSREQSELSSALGVIFLCVCLPGFPPKSKLNNWWLWWPSVGQRFVSQPTGFWVWLTCLRRQRMGMGVGGWRHRVRTEQKCLY